MIASREIDWPPWRGPAIVAGVRCSPQCLRHNAQVRIGLCVVRRIGECRFFCGTLTLPLSVSVAN